MMARYRKKPVAIEAVQLDGTLENANQILEWIGRHGGNAVRGHNRRLDVGIIIRTLEGDMVAQPGDWIIRGVKGEFYPCKPDIFAATYDPVIEDDEFTCIGCGNVVQDGELVFHEHGEGGLIHAECAGPERDSYCTDEGEPLGPDDPLPTPFPYVRAEYFPTTGKSTDAQDIASRLRRFFNEPGDARRLALDAALMIEYLNKHPTTVEERNTRSQALKEAAQVAYRVCAETRHVTLGDKAAAAIRALSSPDHVDADTHEKALPSLKYS